jgi:ribulose-5-phosphate 4-epimerase/fuculose-1-phosphate aldolase
MLREICDVFKEAYRRGWITTRDGNASYRRPEQNWFYVTPSGVRKNELVPDMCIKLDIDERGWSRDRWLAADDGLLKQQLNRGLRPTGELPMHWYLQRDLSRTEHPRVVLHLHPTHVIAATRYLLEKRKATFLLCSGSVSSTQRSFATRRLVASYHMFHRSLRPWQMALNGSC